MKHKYQLKIISLFSGIGGFELGLDQVGQTTWANEWNKFSIQTYQANFPSHNLSNKDIREVKAEEIPPHSILVGGFPCQTFSTAQQDKAKRGLNDPRGHLFKEILRIAKHHKPTWLLLENVKGLTFKPNREAFNQIITGIKDLGYQVNWKVLNARDFGLPQNRERVFFVANRLNIDFVFPKPTKQITKAGDIFEPIINPKYYLSEKTWSSLKARKEKNLAKGSGLGYKLFDENSPYINTLTTNSASEYVIKDKDKVRKLTPRECLRLQGFSDDYKIVVSDHQTYRQAGNAVAVPVIKAIGVKIKETFLNFLTESGIYRLIKQD